MWTGGTAMILLGTIFLGSQLVIAVADGVPKIDVKNTCRNAAAVTGTLTRQAIDTCIADEQSAREELVKNWAQFPAAARANCVHTSTDYLPSYVEVLTCLSMARDVKNIPEEKALSSSKRRR
jgi:hypothetical protein